MAVDIRVLRKLLGTPRDNAMLRLALAGALADQSDPRKTDLEEARTHLETALAMDESYTAAWKKLGKVLLQLANEEEAAKAWARGIDIARKNGDKQAEKEMAVFTRRLQRKS